MQSTKLKRKKQAKKAGFDLGLPALTEHPVGISLTNEDFPTGVIHTGKFTKDEFNKFVTISVPKVKSSQMPEAIQKLVDQKLKLKAAREESTLSDKLVQELESNGPEVQVLCKKYGLKREELGRLTGFSVRALADWAAKKLPSHPAQRRLHEVRRLLDGLSEIVKPAAIPTWLHKRNPAFEGMTPLQVIEVGEIDRLWGMIYRMGSGQPG